MMANVRIGEEQRHLDGILNIEQLCRARSINFFSKFHGKM